MKEILFATGNPRKIAEANDTLSNYDIRITPVSVEIEEIQHHDPAEITKAKARAAFAVLGKPVVVSDTSWSIPALGGFPGGYMKDVGIWWAEEDWLNIMKKHDDKSIICLEHLAYFDGNNLAHFAEEYDGHFLDKAQGSVANEIESFERVVALYGDRSLAEGVSGRGVSSKPKLLGHWQQFAEWYKN